MAVSVHLEGYDSVDVDLRDAPSITRRAVVRALRRAITAARTLMVREISKDVGLKSKDVKDALRMTEPSFSNPTAQLAAKLKRIPLIRFSARGPEPSRGRGKGVTYRLGQRRGRNEHAFIAVMKSGHRGVFKRKSTKRLPIYQLYGPSLGHVFEKYQPAGQARAIEMFEKNLDHELTFAKSQASTAVPDDAGTD